MSTIGPVYDDIPALLRCVRDALALAIVSGVAGIAVWMVVA